MPVKLGKLLKKIFNPRPIDNFVSEIDVFLQNFDATHPANPSVEAEKQKHQKTAYLRDHAVKKDVGKVIWKDF